MEKHYGQIVEYVVRRNGYSITDLAADLDLNRRTIYNYFQNKYLKYDVIYKIGLLVRHDFSKEFPELFTSEQFDIKNAHIADLNLAYKPNIDDDLWKEKYIKLLEKYNNVLNAQILVTDLN